MKTIWTIGVPGAGKTTWARSHDPKTHCVVSLDDVRTALFGSKRGYWAAQEKSPKMRELVHDVHDSAIICALDSGFTPIIANTHLWTKKFKTTWAVVQMRGASIDLVVFQTPWPVICERNATRPEDDRVPEPFLSEAYAAFWSPDAWWRKHPHRLIHDARVVS